MPRRCNNGLGILLLVAIMAVTPLVPVAVSAPLPQWVWDKDGKVHDASGQYRVLTEEEACLLFGFCKKTQETYPEMFSGGGGDSSGGGGCR